MQNQLLSSLAKPSRTAAVEASFFRSTSNQDNRFRTARNLGTASTLPRTFRASGFVGRSDRIDVYRYVTRSGLFASGITGNVKIQKGSVRYSTFRQTPGTGIELFGRGVVGRGTTPLAGGASPPNAARTTFFIVFDRPTQDTNYSFRITYQP